MTQKTYMQNKNRLSEIKDIETMEQKNLNKELKQKSPCS